VFQVTNSGLTEIIKSEYLEEHLPHVKCVLLVVGELGRDGFAEGERAVQGIESVEAVVWGADSDILLLDPSCRRIRGKESH
jgi:hypothetical protein